MWQIYELTEFTTPDTLDILTNIVYHPQVFQEYEDLALELSEICNRHQLALDIHYHKTMNNLRVGIPSLNELNSVPSGTDYHAYSLSIDFGKQKVNGFIKKMNQ